MIYVAALYDMTDDSRCGEGEKRRGEKRVKI